MTSPRPFRRWAFPHADLTRSRRDGVPTGGGSPFRVPAGYRRTRKSSRRLGEKSAHRCAWRLPGDCLCRAGALATREAWPLVLSSQDFWTPKITKNIQRWRTGTPAGFCGNNPLLYGIRMSGCGTPRITRNHLPAKQKADSPASAGPRGRTPLLVLWGHRAPRWPGPGSRARKRRRHQA